MCAYKIYFTIPFYDTCFLAQPQPYSKWAYWPENDKQIINITN